MTTSITVDPHALLRPLKAYIVEDLSNDDTTASAALAEAALGKLAEPLLQILSAGGAQTDDVAVQFLPIRKTRARLAICFSGHQPVPASQVPMPTHRQPSTPCVLQCFYRNVMITAQSTLQVSICC